ncbi:HD domain-containing protein [Paraburkholderia pallida]|uniref:HD domain-containing protein n=1 Tax=Paraburkholderia pallida TaxID=2547399 RepID=A0A4P7CTK4_9BURK|nr:HD domain-containing protein [Paraburkholderia pallida]QBQ97163.1 HD domain-containing protein [Paraburkholderia pallida]
MKPAIEAQLNRDNIVAFLGDIFARRGGEEYLGEGVTMAEHMLQAAFLAEQRGESDTIIVAALLHDIGHFVGEFGAFSMSDTHDRYHEQAGAQALQHCFPRVITDCVSLHVAAKRYLCAVDPNYFDKLSPASVHSLRLQGGAMNAAEVAEFSQRPHLQDALTVRLLDDAAKSPGLRTPDFAHYAPLIESIVSAHCGNA